MIALLMAGQQVGTAAAAWSLLHLTDKPDARVSTAALYPLFRI